VSLPRQLRKGLEARFEWLETLGEGACGWVELVRERGLDRRVALKLGKHKSDPGRVARFVREAEIAAGLRHPNLVAVHSTGELDGHPYLVLDYVEGAVTLREALQDAPLARRLEVFRDAIRGVAAAHARGVIHRDLKPENVLVDPQGVARVTDFGSATMQGLERLTRTGALVGTPYYMAPEQIAGSRDDLGPHTDVWALGVMLHELVCGERPFESGSLLGLAGAIKQGLRKVELPPDAPRGIAAVVARCLSPEPSARYADARALGEALDAACAGGRGARRPAALAAAGLGAALGVGLLAWALSPDDAPDPGPEPVPPPPPTEPDAQAPAEHWAQVQQIPDAQGFLAAGEAWLAEHPADPLRATVEQALYARRRAEPRYVIPCDGEGTPSLVDTREALFVRRGTLQARELWAWSWSDHTLAPRPYSEGIVALASPAASQERCWLLTRREKAKLALSWLARIPRQGEAYPEGTPLDELGVSYRTLASPARDEPRFLICVRTQWSLYRGHADGSVGLLATGETPYGARSPKKLTLLPSGTHALFVGRDAADDRMDVLRVVRLADDAVVAKRVLTSRLECCTPISDERLLIGNDIGQLIETDLSLTRWVLLENEDTPEIAFVGHPAIADELYALEVGPGGRLYALGLEAPGEGALQVWDLETHTLRDTHPLPVYTVSLLGPDGRYLVGARQGKVEVWDRWLPGEWQPPR